MRELEAPATPTKARVIAFRRLRRGDEDATRVIELVAAARRVPGRLILSRSRGMACVASARQIAMYLMHVVLGRDYAAVGNYFDRDRTTVSHACARVEDRRDDPAFDAELARLESALAEPVGVEEQHRAAG
jgi:chromosomal replication initiation ATPase DnaA